MTEIEIKDLILKAKKGDSEAFGQVYREYFTPLYRYLYFRLGDKSLADDLVQEVFLRVFESLDRVTISERSPLTYFYTIARNLLIDNYRKKNIPTIDETEAVNKLIEEDNPERQAILQGDIAKLRNALQKISSAEADALILKFIDNYSNKEIGQIMGKSEDSVRQLQSRGLKSLREFINQADFI
jgi:RNA polymerase sigma-70 factor (ECF subfamily)